MGSEDKIAPEEFDRELEALMAGTNDRRKKGRKRKLLPALAAAVLAAASAFYFLAPSGPQSVSVETVNPVREQIQNRLSVSGPVTGTDSVDVVSNLHAEVLEIPVKEGEKVKKGQVIAVLDAAELQKEAEIAENDYQLALSTCEEKEKEVRRAYEKAQQDFRTAQASYDRNRVLFESGDIPAVEMETAQNTLNDAKRALESFTLKDGKPAVDASYEYQVKKALFDFEKVQKQLEDTEIKSPIDGTVVRVNTKVGRFADNMEDGQPLFVIENLDVLEMEIKVSEYSIGKVAVGQEADVRADILDGGSVRGQVISISPTGEEKGGGSAERVIPATIRILDQDTKLIAGITARADIVLEEKEDALTLPITALFDRDGQTYVQAVKEGMVHWIPVRTGVEGDVRTEVIPEEEDALDESSQVIAAPGETYAEGMPVLAAPQ